MSESTDRGESDHDRQIIANAEKVAAEEFDV
jgi:hypothetical protein